MFRLNYESFSVLCDVFLLKSVISRHNGCVGPPGQNGSLLYYCHCLQTDRCHNWKLPGYITSWYILLIYITWEALFFFSMNQERREDIYTLESKFFYIICKALFLNYNISHKLLSNKETVVGLWLLLYKLCKITMKLN